MGEGESREVQEKQKEVKRDVGRRERGKYCKKGRRMNWEKK